MKTLKSNFNLSLKVSKFKLKKFNWSQIILLIFLMLLIVIGILPGYLKGGQWSWLDLTQLNSQSALSDIKREGISLPGWQTEEQGQIQLGDKKWSWQKMVKNNQTFTLILSPQTYYLDSPEVEWTDLKSINADVVYCNSQLYQLMDADPKILGIESQFSTIRKLIRKEMLSRQMGENLVAQLPKSCRDNFKVSTRDNQVQIFGSQNMQDWQTDSYQKLTVTLKSGKKIKTQFFRGRNRQQTFAVVQWYSWDSGGNFAPRKWFFADLSAQLQKRRAPWVAVSVRIPIKILGKIETVKPLAESIVREVQTAISQKIIAN